MLKTRSRLRRLAAWLWTARGAGAPGSLVRPQRPFLGVEGLEDRTVPVRFNYANFSSLVGLALNGDAAQAGTVLRVAPDQNSQAGSVFYRTSINTNRPFTTHFQFLIDENNDRAAGPGTRGFNAADGLVFMVQGDPRGLNALGGDGGDMGYGDQNSPGALIRNSVAVEFDIFENDYDPNDNHVAVDTNGNVENPVAIATPVLDLTGQSLHAWVDYHSSSRILQVFLGTTATKPRDALICTRVDLASIVGPRGFIGFSAGTGGFSADHDLVGWDFLPKIKPVRHCPPPPPNGGGEGPFAALAFGRASTTPAGLTAPAGNSGTNGVPRTLPGGTTGVPASPNASSTSSQTGGAESAAPVLVRSAGVTEDPANLAVVALRTAPGA